MAEKYRDLNKRTFVWAYQVPDGSQIEVVDSWGFDRYVAYPGDWVICSPYDEVVDDESFNRDYERIEE